MRESKDSGKKQTGRWSRGRTEFYRFEKVVWFVLGGLILLLGIALGARLIINRLFQDDYNNFRYEKAIREEKLLIRLNFPEGYIPYYNIGCAYYASGEYQQAESYFRAALRQGAPHRAAEGATAPGTDAASGSTAENAEESSTPENPQESPDGSPALGAPSSASIAGSLTAGLVGAADADAECDIRVNTALSIIRQIDTDHFDTESGRTKAIEKLQNARGILTAEGCADEEGDGGHDPEAIQLREEIDEWLSQLMAQSESQEESEEDSDSDRSEEQDDSNSQDRDGREDPDSGENSSEGGSGGGSSEDGSSNGNSGESGSSGGSGSSDANGGSSSAGSSDSGLNERSIRRQLERDLEKSREQQRESEEEEKYYEYYFYGNGDEGNGGVWW